LGATPLVRSRIALAGGLCGPRFGLRALLLAPGPSRPGIGQALGSEIEITLEAFDLDSPGRQASLDLSASSLRRGPLLGLGLPLACALVEQLLRPGQLLDQPRPLLLEASLGLVARGEVPARQRHDRGEPFFAQLPMPLGAPALARETPD